MSKDIKHLPKLRQWLILGVHLSEQQRNFTESNGIQAPLPHGPKQVLHERA